MSSKRLDIQGIRAWAVLAVVIFHFFPSLLPWGSLGVDVFFVLSGFLITLIMERKSCLVSTYVDFFFKRFKRIFPLALLIAVINLLMVSLNDEMRFVQSVTRSAIYSLFFGANYNVREAKEDYFDAIDQATDYFTHYWSLAVEIQFYAIAPCLLHILRPNSIRPARLLIYLSLIASLSFVISIYLPQENAFNSTLCRIYQFLAGSMAFSLREIFPTDIDANASCIMKPSFGEISDAPLLSQNPTGEGVISTKPMVHFLYLIPLVSIASGFILVTSIGDFDSLLRLSVTVAAAFLLFHQSSSPFLCHKQLQLLGDASYALYLVHWPVVCLLKDWAVHDALYVMAAIFTCIVISILIHLTYEKWYLSLSVHGTFVLVGVLYLLCFSLVFYNSMRSAQEFHLGGFDPVESLLRWKPGNSSNFSAEQVQAMNRLMDDQLAERLLFSDCIPRRGAEEIHIFNCIYNFCNHRKDLTNVRTFNFCDFPNGYGNYSFLMIGNSYTFATGRFVLHHFEEHYSRMAIRSIPWCEPLIKTNRAEIHNAHKKFLEAVEREMPDVLFISARYDRPEVPIVGNISSDPLYLYMLNKLRGYEKFVKEKVFILNSLPRLHETDEEADLRKSKGLDFTPEAIIADDEPMRRRNRELAKNCDKCVVYDIRGQHLNEKGEFMTHDPDTKLRYFDRSVHYTSVGEQLIEPVFSELSREFHRLMASKYPKNVFELKN